jgi:hypothetical protein
LIWSKPSGESRTTSSSRTSCPSVRNRFSAASHVDRIPEHDDVHHEADRALVHVARRFLLAPGAEWGSPLALYDLSRPHFAQTNVVISDLRGEVSCWIFLSRSSPLHTPQRNESGGSARVRMGPLLSAPANSRHCSTCRASFPCVGAQSQ